MIRRLEAFFSRFVDTPDAEKGRRSDRALQMAAGILLVEVARSDQHMDPRESRLVERQLREVFGLGEAEVHELLRLVERDADTATSLFPFTRLINERFDSAEKTRLVELLWEVAYADGCLDPYEEGLIRKIADLLYVPHRDFIRAKHRGELSLIGNRNTRDASD